VLGLSHEDQVRTHVYSEVFKVRDSHCILTTPTAHLSLPDPRLALQEFIRRVGRECLTDETLEAYNTDQQERSLYRSVIVSLPPCTSF
jgi:hypothetical protein